MNRSDCHRTLDPSEQEGWGLPAGNLVAVHTFCPCRSRCQIAQQSQSARVVVEDCRLPSGDIHQVQQDVAASARKQVIGDMSTSVSVEFVSITSAKLWQMCGQASPSREDSVTYLSVGLPRGVRKPICEVVRGGVLCIKVPAEELDKAGVIEAVTLWVCAMDSQVWPPRRRKFRGG